MRRDAPSGKMSRSKSQVIVTSATPLKIIRLVAQAFTIRFSR